MEETPRSSKEIFGAALELPETERTAFLERACAGDHALRAKVDELLSLYASAGTFLSAPSAGRNESAEAPEDARPPARIGPYKILRRIGEGGFGTVYLAEQETPVSRRVALKVIKLGMDTRAVIARFEAERQALALMDHPHIARVFDAGATESGRPYFAMELVEGEPITAHCDRARLSIAERLELFQAVCLAVQHAHQKGVIHRDLKPSNVLVTTVDGRPVPKVIDFGVAKATSAKLTERTLVTAEGLFIGTPAYMSPEQTVAGATDVDTRSDIYSLGVLLYELLAGTPPFEPARLRSAAFDEVLRILREEEPAKPSTRASSAESSAAVAESRREEPRELARHLRGDLDWIALKCLEKDPGRRYDSASALEQDIERHLRHEPVLASPPSATYRLRKFVRRNRLAVAAGSALAAALVLGLIGTTWGVFWALDERRLARLEERRATGEALAATQQRDKSERIATFLETMLSGIKPSIAMGRDTAMLKEMLDVAAKRILDGELRNAPEAELRLRLVAGEMYVEIGELQRARDMLDPTIDMARVWHGPDCEIRARALRALGDCLIEQGQIPQALALQEEALEIERRLDATSIHMAWSLGSVARCLQGGERYKEALGRYREAMSVTQRHVEEQPLEHVGAINNIAQLRWEQGAVAEALEGFREAAVLLRSNLEGDHPSMATSLANEGMCLLSLGRAAEALPAFEAALCMRRVLHRGDHPRLADASLQLGRCLCELSRHADGLPLLRDALEMFRRIHGADHRDTVVALFQYASCLDALSLTTEALPMAEEAIEMGRRLRAADHRGTAACLNLLGKCLASAGRPREALDRFRESLAMWKRLAVPGCDEEIAKATNNAAFALVSMGEATEALMYYEEALAIARRLHRAPDEVIGIRLLNLGHCLMELNRPEPALARFEDALEMLQAVHPGDYVENARALNNVALALQTLGRSEEALPKLEAAVEMARKLFPQGHASIAIGLHNIGNCLHGLHREPERAEDSLREGLDMQRHLFGDDHPMTTEMWRSLAELLRSHGQLEEAAYLAGAAFESFGAHPDWPDVDRARVAEVLLTTLDEAGRWSEVADVLAEVVAGLRFKVPAGDPFLAPLLMREGRALLRVRTGEAARRAELVLRECVAIREKTSAPDHADAWQIDHAKSLLGEALFQIACWERDLDPGDRRERLVAAESLLSEAAERLQPRAELAVLHREVLQRLLEFYDARHLEAPGEGFDAKAAACRTRLQALPETPTVGR